MATADKKTVQDDLNFNSERLSTQVRLIGFGLLAIVWAIVINPPAKVTISHRGLLAVACVVIASMLIDLLQYAAGYIASVQVFSDLEARHERGYPKKGFRRLRVICFWGKQVGVLLAGLIFLVVVVPNLL